MTLEENLKQIIGQIWYVRDRFDVIAKNKGVMDRARSVEEIVSICMHALDINYIRKRG